MIAYSWKVYVCDFARVETVKLKLNKKVSPAERTQTSQAYPRPTKAAFIPPLPD